MIRQQPKKELDNAWQITMWVYNNAANAESLSLTKVVIPSGVKRISGNMIDDFKGSDRLKSMVLVEMPSDAQITPITDSNPYIWSTGPNIAQFESRSVKLQTEDIDLESEGTSVSLIIDGQSIEGALLYNGVTYVKHSAIGKGYEGSYSKKAATWKACPYH